MTNPCQQSPIVVALAGKIRDESGPAGRQSDEAQPINNLGAVIDQ